MLKPSTWVYLFALWIEIPKVVSMPDGVFRLLPFRIRCMAHAYNLLGSVDAAKALESGGQYKKVSRSFHAKVHHIWTKQSTSDQIAELIEEIVGCKFKKPNDTRLVRSIDQFFKNQNYFLTSLLAVVR